MVHALRYSSNWQMHWSNLRHLALTTPVHNKILWILQHLLAQAKVVILPTQLQSAGASRIIGGETTGTGVA